MKHSFLIITPVINANDLLAETINSVVRQNGLGEKFTITYIIADAGSTQEKDSNAVDDVLSLVGAIEHINFIHLKYKDKSMYDGIVNALSFVKDKDFTTFAYINSGDYYSPYAFSAVINEQKKMDCDLSWICGCVGSYNSKGMLYKLIEPVAYPNSLIKCGVFGRYLPYIQQESNFISYKLVKKLDFSRLASFKYAGDFFIWKSLADVGLKPTILPIWLAGFREHDGQLSSVHKKEYKTEFNSLSDKITLTALIKSLLICMLYSIHPRLRWSKLVFWMRQWS